MRPKAQKWVAGKEAPVGHTWLVPVLVDDELAAQIGEATRDLGITDSETIRVLIYLGLCALHREVP